MKYRRLISSATRLREYQRSIGKLKKAIRSITGTYVDSIILEEIVAKKTWAADQLTAEKAELQKLVSDILETPYDMPPKQKALTRYSHR